MRRESFEDFYYRHVALGEGCGCAESVTRMLELDAYAKTRSEGRVVSEAPGAAWHGVVGLIRRMVAGLRPLGAAPPAIPAVVPTPGP